MQQVDVRDPFQLRLGYESTEVHLVKISLSHNNNGLRIMNLMDDHKVLTDQSEEIIKVESSIGSVSNNILDLMNYQLLKHL